MPGFESSSWQALLGPAKIPGAIVDRLYRQIEATARMPDLQQRLIAEGLLPLGTTPQELDEHIAREMAKWDKVTRAAGLNVH